MSVTAFYWSFTLILVANVVGFQKALALTQAAETSSCVKDGDFSTPIPGPTKGLPNSADVHLYADISTLHTQSPFLFADCEGLDGGNAQPLAAKIKQKLSEKGIQWYE